MKITQPTIIIHEERAKANLQEMAAKIENSGASFRPHFKTHQSLDIGKWYKEMGITKITVSSLSMAKYFSSDWNDITVAFPVNVAEIDLINELSASIALNLCVESEDAMNFLSAHLENEVGIFLKMDIGYHRTGIDPTNDALISNLIEQCKADGKPNLKGFLGHSGHSYGGENNEAIVKIYNDSSNVLKTLKAKYGAEFTISYGDTPTCSVVDNFSGLDELRPGNHIFYDMAQVDIGSCQIDQIAAAVACPVVAIHPEAGKAIIYGGGVHFSKDQLDGDYKDFGAVIGGTFDNWGTPIEGVRLAKLSQEHGTITAPKSYLENLKIGDTVLVLPVHSCMTCNLHDHYISNKGQRLNRI